jgi:glucans biosynthesis protein
MDVEMTLYPRVELKLAGLAPLTNLFAFGPNNRVGIDNFRTAVNDSDGLAIWNDRGEWLWRPLSNPETLQISEFIDDNPRGFGLLQQHRAFADYQDLEAHYERRPSLWVEPIGYWGNGAVQLVEIPSKSEYHDNIVVFWRSSQPIPVQAEERRTYRLYWCWTPPVTPPLATTADTRVGAGLEKDTRLFALDFVGGRLADLTPDAPVTMAITTSAGTVKQRVAQPNPGTGGWRVNFVLDPAGAKLCEWILAPINRADTPWTARAWRPMGRAMGCTSIPPLVLKDASSMQRASQAHDCNRIGPRRHSRRSSAGKPPAAS